MNLIVMIIIYNYCLCVSSNQTIKKRTIIFKTYPLKIESDPIINEIFSLLKILIKDKETKNWNKHNLNDARGMEDSIDNYMFASF